MSTLAVTNVFASGTVISSSAVNTNFDDVEAVVNALTSTNFAAGAVNTAAIADLAVTAAKIANNTITATQLAATLTFADADYVDFAAILHNDTALQGLRLPQIGASPTAPTSGEGQIGWNQTDNFPVFYDGTDWIEHAAFKS